MSKWAAAREDGLKPWVRTSTEWGRTRDRIVYAATSQDAKHIEPIMRYEHVRVRRATPADMNLGVRS